MKENLKNVTEKQFNRVCEKYVDETKRTTKVDIFAPTDRELDILLEGESDNYYVYKKFGDGEYIYIENLQYEEEEM